MISMFEYDNQISHFMYFQAKEQKIHLFKCIFSDQKLGRGRKNREVRQVAESIFKNLSQLGKKDNKEKINVAIIKLDQFLFRP